MECYETSCQNRMSQRIFVPGGTWQRSRRTFGITYLKCIGLYRRIGNRPHGDREWGRVERRQRPNVRKYHTSYLWLSVVSLNKQSSKRLSHDDVGSKPDTRFTPAGRPKFTFCRNDLIRNKFTWSSTSTWSRFTRLEAGLLRGVGR